MAKRKEIILQETLNSQEVWDEAMTKPNLYVVDAHQKWCGPCVAIVSMLKRIKNELGDDLLKFATAEVDAIDSLEQYRGKCEPNFLFFGSGHLIGAVRGCNAPLIQSTIESTLAAEHKVLSGDGERKVISDLYSPSPDIVSVQGDSEESIEESVVPKKFTVALIKPDVVENGQVDEIVAKIEEAGIEILANDERMLSEEEAAEFYKHKSEEEFFNDLIKYVTSGPCRVLLLTKGDTGEGVVELWRDIIGPFDAAVAKNENPDSLRSIYGENATKNALHGSTSEEEAVRELGFFYPNYNLPTCTLKRTGTAMSRRSARDLPSEKRIERTLALIRPDALRKHRDAILQKIEESGFKIAMQKEVTLTTEQAEDFYSEHRDQEYFAPLVKQMTCGPVLALCLASDDAVNRWRKMLGPKVVAKALEQEPESLRAQFQGEDADLNMLHGSDTTENAENELTKLFKLEQTFAVIKPDAMSEKEKIISKLEEAGFMISCQKDLNLSKEIAGEIYKSKKGADFYDDLVNYMTSGNTLTMVLSAENAVQKLRDLMGPVDPEEARANNPESLRAQFAKTVMENAIHAASSPGDAETEIKLIFGDVTFDWDGATSTDDTHESPKPEATGVGQQEAASKSSAAIAKEQIQEKISEIPAAPLPSEENDFFYETEPPEESEEQPPHEGVGVVEPSDATAMQPPTSGIEQKEIAEAKALELESQPEQSEGSGQEEMAEQKTSATGTPRPSSASNQEEMAEQKLSTTGTPRQSSASSRKSESGETAAELDVTSKSEEITEMPSDIASNQQLLSTEAAPAEAQETQAEAVAQEEAPAEMQEEAPAETQETAPAETQEEAPAEAQEAAPAETQEEAPADQEPETQTEEKPEETQEAEAEAPAAEEAPAEEAAATEEQAEENPAEEQA